MYVGIDIGGTNIKSGVVDSSGKILLSKSFKTDSDAGPMPNLEKIKNTIIELINQFSGILSIGIGVPGIVDREGFLNISPNLQNWHGINIHDELRKYFNLAIAVDNDANAAAIAEMEIGAGKDIDNFIYITLGTGIGGAIIINNKIFRGCDGGAGEIGHTIINFNDVKKDIPLFRQGTLEEMAGRNQIIQRMQKIITKYQFRITKKDKDFDIFKTGEFDVEDIANTANSGFQPAIDCLQQTGEIIGLGLSSAMNLLDVPVAIIGGGVSQAGDILFESIRQTIKQRALPTITKKFEVREALFKNNTGIIGAAMLGANKLKELST